MKFLRLLLFVLTAGILFTSCQKELSAETGSAIGTIAKDAGGNCTPATPSGAYKKDTALNATNFVDIQLDITNVGIYIVTTDTVNGYYFRATGVTPLPGVNIIRLVGFGKPIVAGTDLFKVKFNTDVCEFAVNVTGMTGGGTTAVFTLGSTAGACSSTINGTFTQGISSVGNSVSVTITVQTPGTYTLSTGLINGVTFSGTGFLSATTTSITLDASGTPQNSGSAIPYPLLISATNLCGFTIPVLPGTGGGGAATDSISATVNSTFKVFNDMASIDLDSTTLAPVTFLLVSGDSTLGNESIGFGIGNLTGVIPAGTYNINQAPAFFVASNYTDAGNVGYSASSNPPTIQNPSFSVTILSITGGALGVTGTRVKGTFTGTVKEAIPGTGVKTITGGYFDLTF